MTIRDAYLAKSARAGHISDPSQLRVVGMLQALQDELQLPPSAVRSWLSRIGISLESKPVKGIYLWGGVGRGKTFLMDLFFSSLPSDRKRRIHFHRMMREVHERLATLGEHENPLQRVAADIAGDTRVLCFDEFFVSDIGDAMVLGRLLEGLFNNGVTLLTTSNSRPDQLYADGLQRERFLPAIALLESHTRVVEMDNDVDYRLSAMQRASTYLTPADDAAAVRLQSLFDDIAPDEPDRDTSKSLDVLGRSIRCRRCTRSVVWFDFDQICDGPRSQNDYIEIARWYQTVIIAGVPVFDRDSENAARRFISLVDEFYDRRVKLILSAAAPIDEIYQGHKLAFEFRRTVSRLTEMQSAKYLHEAHIV